MEDVKKVFQTVTSEKIEEALQEKLNSLVSRDLLVLVQKYQTNHSHELNQVLEEIKKVFEQIEPTSKSEYYLAHVSETCSKILNFSILKLDLKNTDNIIEKFKFKNESLSDQDQDFDNLLKIYFELNFMTKIFADSVDLKKFENSIPKPISLEHL